MRGAGLPSAMVRSCVACAVCALLLLCLSSSARAARGADDLCVAGEQLVTDASMSPAPATARLAAPHLQPALVFPDRDRGPAGDVLCLAGADAAGQCRVDGPAGSGSDPRPASQRVLHAGCLAAQKRPGAPPPRVVPRHAGSDTRRCPGYARGIERPPRAP